MNAGQHRGFSLLELMVTLVVGGIVLGVGVPSFLQFQRNNAMIAQANDLVTGLYLARAEAVKRQVPITFCASADATTPAPTCGLGGETGYIVFVDDADPLVVAGTDGNAVVDDGELILMQHAAPGGTIDLFADSSYVAFGIKGFVVAQAPGQAQRSATNLLFCDDRGNQDTGGRSSARVVTISPTGRAQVMQNQLDVEAAVAVTGGDCP
jgi:prepilin-type N-terminal cleavage/methylation domain-containing protein